MLFLRWIFFSGLRYLYQVYQYIDYDSLLYWNEFKYFFYKMIGLNEIKIFYKLCEKLLLYILIKNNYKIYNFFSISII